METTARAASRERFATYRERSLHAALKELYTRPGDRQEAEVDGFLVDVLREEGIVEIQTGSFASVRSKLRRLVSNHRVLVVFPITIEKWIVRVDADGCLLGRRRSPKRGDPVDVFDQLVTFPELVADANFALELLAVREDELRAPIPADSGRRRWPRDWQRIDRRLLEVVGSTVVSSAGDLGALLPRAMPDPFTTSELAAATRRPLRLAQRMAYCLQKVGCLEVAGRHGRSVAYRRPTPAPLASAEFSMDWVAAAALIAPGTSARRPARTVMPTGAGVSPPALGPR